MTSDSDEQAVMLDAVMISSDARSSDPVNDENFVADVKCFLSKFVPSNVIDNSISL